MKKNYGILIWLLLMILTMFLVFVIPSQITKQIWTIVVFDVIAFVSQLLIWFTKDKDTHETFYKYPAVIVSTMYLAVQFLISMVVAILNESIPFKVVLTVNVVFLVIMWVVILFELIAKDKIVRLDSRQKNHHIEL